MVWVCQTTWRTCYIREMFRAKRKGPVFGKTYKFGQLNWHWYLLALLEDLHIARNHHPDRSKTFCNSVLTTVKVIRAEEHCSILLYIGDFTRFQTAIKTNLKLGELQTE